MSNHTHYRGQWVAHARPFFDTKLLNAVTKEEVQKEALDMFAAEIEATSDGLSAYFKAQQGDY